MPAKGHTRVTSGATSETSGFVPVRDTVLMFNHFKKPATIKQNETV